MVLSDAFYIKRNRHPYLSSFNAVPNRASLLLNRIKIRNKFSRYRYIKLTWGISLDKGGALEWSDVKRKVVVLAHYLDA